MPESRHSDIAGELDHEAVVDPFEDQGAEASPRPGVRRWRVDDPDNGAGGVEVVNLNQPHIHLKIAEIANLRADLVVSELRAVGNLAQAVTLPRMSGSGRSGPQAQTDALGETTP